MSRYLFCLLFLTGCASHVSTQTALRPNVLEEVRIALFDMQQAHNEQRIQVELLEEQIAKLKFSPSTNPLEARVRHLEKALETIESNLQRLGTHANQTTQSLQQHQKRLDEISKLKGTLNSISQAIANPRATTYKVRSGDSLEKIARRCNTSVGTLKKMNQLTSNTIQIGQELKVPE